MPATTASHRRVLCTVFAITAALISSPGWAADSPSASEIKSAVSGHTYQGSMSGPNSGFAEFYAEGGTIQGIDYTGTWTTKDGAMCFAYGEKPTCYQVTLEDPSMVLRKDGEIMGSGMLIEGNAFDQ
jgi:hypothetical protein